MKQMILAAYFPGVNNTTVWMDPRSKSQIEIESFIHLAQTAERGKLDFFFLAEGLRLREQRGRIHDLDTVGRPDTMAVLTALVGVTTHLGLAGTLNATFHEPYEMARQLATLDHLSGGRAAWNVVTSSDAFTGENFRRGGFLDHADRYLRAEEFIDVCRQLWDSWAADEVVADATTGRFVRDGNPGAFEHHGAQFDIHGHFNVPRSPQVHPVILQAGDSDGGRELAARTADCIFTRHSSISGGSEVRRRRQGAPGPLRPGAGGPEDPPGGLHRPRRHRGRGRGVRPLHPPPAGQPADGHPAAGAGVEPGPVGLRPGGPAARRRPRPRCGLDHPGPGADARRPDGDGRPVPGDRRGEGLEHPRPDHRGVGADQLRRHAEPGGGDDGRVRPVRRLRRLRVGPLPHPGRPRRLRRPGGPAPARARRPAQRVHHHDAARPPRPPARRHHATPTTRRRRRAPEPRLLAFVSRRDRAPPGRGATRSVGSRGSGGGGELGEELAGDGVVLAEGGGVGARAGEGAGGGTAGERTGRVAAGVRPAGGVDHPQGLA